MDYAHPWMCFLYKLYGCSSQSPIYIALNYNHNEDSLGDDKGLKCRVILCSWAFVVIILTNHHHQLNKIDQRWIASNKDRVIAELCNDRRWSRKNYDFLCCSKGARSKIPHTSHMDVWGKDVESATTGTIPVHAISQSVTTQQQWRP